MKLSLLPRHAGSLTFAAGCLFAATQLLMLWRIGVFNRGDATWRLALLDDPLYLAGGVLYFATFCVLLLAIVAIHTRREGAASTWWDIGIGTALVGVANLGGNFWFEGFATPWLASVAPEALSRQPSGLLVLGAYLSYGLFTAGWVLFGIAGLRTRAFPGLIALAVVVGGLLAFVASPPFGVPLGLALAWLGAWMLVAPAGRRMAAPVAPSRPAPVE